jgi:hypothetical protein
MRMAAVCAALQQLSELGEVSRSQRGYQLNHPFPVSRPIDPKGNGNGKRSLILSSETEAGSAEEQPAEG